MYKWRFFFHHYYSFTVEFRLLVSLISFLAAEGFYPKSLLLMDVLCFLIANCTVSASVQLIFPPLFTE